MPGTGVGTALFGWTSLPWLWAIGHRTLVIAVDGPVTPLVNHRIIASLMPWATLHTVRAAATLSCLIALTKLGR